MKTPLLLRIAAVLTLLYFAGHTAGMPWTPVNGLKEKALFYAMRSDTFAVSGSTRSYWDFYYGFGVAISVYLLAQAVVLWQLASVARRDPMAARPMIATFFVAFIGNAIIAWRWFFFMPALFAVAIAVVLAIAFSRARPAP